MKKILLTPLALAFCLGASSASAQAVKQFDNVIYGSDTLVGVMQAAFPSAIGNAYDSPTAGHTNYGGIGSSAGQRQLEGGYVPSGSTASEPTCDPPGTANPGCQEISPMSRPLNSAVCDDAEAPNRAEGIAICGDSLLMTVDNNDTCGGDLGSNWQSKLRTLYLGCETGESGAACAAVARATRCTRASRAALISSWGNYVAGSCATGSCSTGLRQAYRRDDSSGTTNVFLELIGGTTSSSALGGRATYRTTLGSTCNVDAPANQVFCDGGSFEGFFNNALTGAVGTGAGQGDPLRKPCDVSDDLCNRDGQVGVVRAIRSVPEEMTNAQAFPNVQCTRNLFKLADFDSTSCKVCPDGTTPIGGKCFLPVYRDAGGNETFNCLNDRTSRPPGASSSFDGRAYNYLVNNATDPVVGTVPVFAATALPEVAQWRQNMATLNTGLAGAAGGPFTSTACQHRDATRNIGCLVGNTSCTTGYAGQEQTTAVGNVNTALALAGVPYTNQDSYGMFRNLYINAIGGFENLSADCLQHNSSASFCQDQVDLVNWFLNPAGGFANAASACVSGGYVALNNGPVCEGAMGSAGCGAPTSQPLSACTPM